jgi:hypothetical protein
MVSFRATLLALASAAFAAADYYIDPTSVDMLTRSMLDLQLNEKVELGANECFRGVVQR